MFNFVKQQTENQYAGITQTNVSCLFHTATIQKKKHSKINCIQWNQKKKPTEIGATSASKEVEYAV
jgi:hypothetical protein